MEKKRLLGTRDRRRDTPFYGRCPFLHHELGAENLGKEKVGLKERREEKEERIKKPPSYEVVFWMLAGETGLEPAALGFGDRCSTN